MSGCGVALVLGGPGSGKTTLAALLADESGGETLVLTASGNRASADTPFGLWSVALDRRLESMERPVVERLCGGVAADLAHVLHSAGALVGRPAGAAADDRPTPVRELRALAGLVNRLGAEHQILVIFDDVDRMDPLSWDLVRELTDRPPPGGILIVLLARASRLSGSPETRVIDDLERRGTRLTLGELGEDEAQEMIESVLGRPVASSEVGRLLELSGGNPGLLRGLLGAGPLPAEPADGHDPPPAVVATVDTWLHDHLGVGCELFDALCVAGSDVFLGDLVRVLDRPLAELDAPLQKLVADGLVREVRQGLRWAYSVSCPVLRRAGYALLGNAGRAALHRRVGETFLRRGRSAESAAHLMRCVDADDDAAVDLLLRFIEDANRRSLPQEGILLLGILRDVLPRGASRWAEVAEALVGWGFDHRVNIDCRLAIAALREIEMLPGTHLSTPRRAAVKARLATLLAWDTGEVEAAEQSAADAMRLYRAAGMPDDARLARLELAYVRGLGRDIAAMADGAQELLDEAVRAGDDAATIGALGAYATAAFFQGDFDSAEGSFRRAITLAHGCHSSRRATRNYVNLAWSLAYQGRVVEALDTCESARAADPAWADSNLADIECNIRYLAGDLAGALGCLDEQTLATPSMRRGMGTYFKALCLVECASHDEAERMIAAARDLYRSREWFVANDHVRYASGLLAWARRGAAAASPELQRAADGLIAMSAPVLAVPILLDLSEAAQECEATEWAERSVQDLRTIAASTDKLVHHAVADLAEAFLARAALDPPRALSAAERAREVFAQVGHRLWEARACTVIGSAQTDLGQDGAPALRDAARTFDSCGALWRRDRTLDRLREMGPRGRRAVGAVMGAQALTGRELEIAQLAALRLRAKDIAERLFLSRRTVESHLSSIYGKLGVHSRADLVEILHGGP